MSMSANRLAPSAFGTRPVVSDRAPWLPGVIYPALTYLEEMGYAASASEGTKKLYRITETGTAYLNENRASVEDTLDQLARFGRKLAEFQKEFAEHEDEERENSGTDSRHGITSVAR